MQTHAPHSNADATDRVRRAEAGDANALRSLRSADLDAGTLRRCARSAFPPLQQLAAERDATPDDAVMALGQIRDLGLQSILLERSRLPGALLLHLSEVDALFHRVLAHPDCPEALLVEASESNEPEIQRLVAGNPRTPDHVIDDLARRSSDTQVEEILWRRGIDKPERLEVFASAMNPDLRTRAALAKETPIPIVARLAHDSDEEVRAAVAQRRDLPPSLARTLAADDAPYVARAARRNPVWRRLWLLRLTGVVLLAAAVAAGLYASGLWSP